MNLILPAYHSEIDDRALFIYLFLNDTQHYRNTVFGFNLNKWKEKNNNKKISTNVLFLFIYLYFCLKYMSGLSARV